ncbi:MAG: hypothetical protein ACT4OZ_01395 [Gemmatimonadota bacterium]
MRLKRFSIAAGAFLIALPTEAWACDFPFNGSFLGRSTGKWSIGGSLGLTTSDPSLLVIAGDATINAGTKAVIRPAIGLCRSGGEGSSSEIVFGGGAGINVWNNADNKVALNVQTGLSFVSFDGGKDITIPVTVAGQFMANERTSFYGGAGMSHNRVSIDETSPGFDGTFSSTDPVLFGGVQFIQTRVLVVLGLHLLMGDGKNLFTLLGGFQVPFM